MRIEPLVRAAELRAKECNEEQAFEWSESMAQSLEIGADGSLHWFALESDGKGGAFCQSKSPIAEELILFTDVALQGCGHGRSTMQVESVLNAAKVEFARDCLAGVLFAADSLQRAGDQEEKAASARLLDWAFTFDWENAGPIAATPPRPWDESPAVSFATWCEYGENPVLRAPSNNVPDCSKHELLAAMALVWVDVAVSNSLRRLELLSEAAQLMCVAEHGKGSESVIRRQREFSALHGKRGAAIRHEKTEQLKAWALAESRNLRGSMMAIARKLSRQVPAHLQDASVDPVRMIYETLRASRKLP